LQQPNLHQKDRHSAPIKATIALTALRILRLIPWRWGSSISRVLTKLSKRLNTRAYATAVTNVDICFPELKSEQRNELVEQSLQSNFQTFLETPHIWLVPWKSLRLELVIENPELLQSALNDPKGCIINLLHTGNWEAFFSGMKQHFDAHCIYRPSRIKQLDTFLCEKREANQWRFVPATKEGARELFASVKKSHATIVASDQVPILGSGEFVPFFKELTLTPTLLPKMLQATGAKLLFATCLRVEKGFSVHFFEPQTDCGLTDLKAAAANVSREMERIIRLHPEQYLWSYKRFKVRPEGLPHLYKK